MPKMPFHHTLSGLFLKLWMAVFCRKFTNVFSSVTLILKLYLASDEAFKKLHASLPVQRFQIQRVRCPLSFSESFAYSLHAGIVERHMLCAQSSMHLAESAAPSGSSRLQSSVKFGSRN